LSGNRAGGISGSSSESACGIGSSSSESGGPGSGGGGGGGGSSYADPNLCSNVTHNQGTQTGNGELSISYTVPYCQSQRVAVNVNVNPLTPPTNVISDSVLCGQTAVVSATPANTPVHWYPDLTNNTPIAIGSSVFLPAMYGSDTLYATSARTNTLSGTHTFSYTGAVQTWTVPAGITSVSVDMSGAEGGAAVSNPSQNLGGKGGRVQTTLSVTPGQLLYIYVGEKPSATTGGWNGGGNGGSSSGGGGGGSDIRIGGQGYSDRILSAGAGGGAGWACGNNDYGGHGGGSGNAANGIRCGQQNNCHCGFGASPTAGGQASQCGCNNQSEFGSLGEGGDFDNCYGNGGGGGGGHYGGGGGGDGGGGGGSSITADKDQVLFSTINGATGSNNFLFNGLAATFGGANTQFTITGPTFTIGNETVVRGGVFFDSAEKGNYNTASGSTVSIAGPNLDGNVQRILYTPGSTNYTVNMSASGWTDILGVSDTVIVILQSTNSFTGSFDTSILTPITKPILGGNTGGIDVFTLMRIGTGNGNSLKMAFPVARGMTAPNQSIGS